MAGIRNPQTIAIAPNATALINIVNPSSSTFLYVWDYYLVPAANANIGFLNQPNNGQAAGTLGGYSPYTTIAPARGTGFSQGTPIFTVDPNSNLVIQNPNTISLSGWVKISN